MPAPPTATFVFSPTSPWAGQTVQFADTSSGDSTSWQWNFGDGVTSTAKNPSHAFSKASSYTVTLISSSNSGSKRGSETIAVTSIASIVASFGYSPGSPVAGQTVQFTDSSTGSPNSWQWNFGDGTSSTAQNPSHTYSTAGSKTVTLTATNTSESITAVRTLTVAPALTTSFTFSPASPTAGQAVQFTDTSIGSPSLWQWNFGDGGTSTSQNPIHTYATAGSKTVTLTVMNSTWSDTEVRTVSVSPILAAAFTSSPATPSAGQAIQFTDTSIGSPSIWQWNFGDGTTSSAQNPSHTYVLAGSYNITLSIMNATGQDNISKIITIAPMNTLVASFTFSPSSPIEGQAVQFTDASTGNPYLWQWDFGDGGGGVAQNPSHTYASTGSYTVTLTVANSSESKITRQNVIVSSSSNDIHYAASPDIADVRAAIAAAEPGDTVIVPAGNATWGSQLYVTKTVNLIGAGQGQTTLRNGFAGTAFNLNNFLVYFNVSSDAVKSLRISGITFDANSGTSDSLAIVNNSLTPLRIRLDHCTFQGYGTSQRDMLRTGGLVWGVVDDCTFNPNDVFAGYQGSARRILVAGYEQNSWTSTSFEYGTADALYFEDNTFYWSIGYIWEGQAGARYVNRHNTFHNTTAAGSTAGCQFMDMHGNYGGMNRYSTMGVEAYENDIDLGNIWGFQFYDARGGKILAYNNRITRGHWFGATAREEGTSFPQAAHDNTSAPALNSINGQPQHVSDTYTWNMIWNGVRQVNLTEIPYALPHVTETIDYADPYLPDRVTPRTGYTADLAYKGVVPRNDVYFWRDTYPFDGSTGMGMGLLANRPMSCSLHGVAYWATDESRLYRWKNGAWELYYIPYTYPHPLRSFFHN